MLTMMPLKLAVCSLVLSSALAFTISRRALIAGATAAAPALLLSQQALAKDEVFKANPLTNGVLEQVSEVVVSLVKTHG